jgi:hypothetical protein
MVLIAVRAHGRELAEFTARPCSQVKGSHRGERFAWRCVPAPLEKARGYFRFRVPLRGRPRGPSQLRFSRPWQPFPPRRFSLRWMWISEFVVIHVAGLLARRGHLPPIRFLIRWTVRAFLFVLFVCLLRGNHLPPEVGLGYGLKERVAAAPVAVAFKPRSGSSPLIHSRAWS